jgi:hypothetical protein
MRGSLTVFGGSCHLAGNTRTDHDHRRGEANANRHLIHTPVHGSAFHQTPDRGVL